MTYLNWVSNRVKSYIYIYQTIPENFTYNCFISMLKWGDKKGRKKEKKRDDEKGGVVKKENIKQK